MTKPVFVSLPSTTFWMPLLSFASGTFSAFVGTRVPAIADCTTGDTLLSLRRGCEALGCTVLSVSLDPIDWGYPITIVRVFLIGIRHDIASRLNFRDFPLPLAPV